jgi:alkylation response protein AidB-like acyl-CoA dehydrogenase
MHERSDHHTDARADAAPPEGPAARATKAERGAPGAGRVPDGAPPDGERHTGPQLVGERLVERMSAAERARALRAEALLPVLREHAAEADARAEFPRSHVARFRDSGLLGLVVPEAYGGLGGTLRDLAATTFALGTACPSTALAYFFHCSSASRGLLALEAIEAGKFSAAEARVVGGFAERLLDCMGREGRWLANFASESPKSEASAVTIETEATPVPGGFHLTGEKSFGCATGVADFYLVTARLAGASTAEGIGLFLVGRDAEGVSERSRWDAIGMRGTATHGIRLQRTFVAEADALAVPGAFTRMMQMSRGSFVGNQLAGTAVYLGAAHALYQHTLDQLSRRRFQDTGRSIADSPLHQQLIGRMAVDLETGFLWLRRQLELETCEPPLLPRAAVVQQWRLCKGEVCEAAFRVAVSALKAGGTSGTDNRGASARALRDLCMGLVQAFPAERGRLEAARMITSEREQPLFGVTSP